MHATTMKGLEESRIIIALLISSLTKSLLQPKWLTPLHSVILQKSMARHLE